MTLDEIDSKTATGEEILSAIRLRLEALRPLVAEYERLALADKGLANIDKHWSPKRRRRPKR